MFLKGIDMNGNKIYLCIDLKSFYASVECVEWGWDPLTARLVVADPERSEKTICCRITGVKADGSSQPVSCLSDSQRNSI